MADKHPLNDIFQRYLNNECSTYEIKYLLKHFISGANDAVLREMIADKLRDHSLDEHLQFEKQSLLTSENLKHNFQRSESNTGETTENTEMSSTFNKQTLIKIVAVLMLVVLLCESIYMYYSQGRDIQVAKAAYFGKGIKPLNSSFKRIK